MPHQKYIKLKTNPEKSSLRKFLLDKRDGISYDFINIASDQIQSNLNKLEVFKKANKIACYYPIGSEVKTEKIIQEALTNGKEVFLPKVIEQNLEFRKIVELQKSLERGNFGIMEPKDQCDIAEQIDIVLVPNIAVTREGTRLGYGYGYYDRFLSKNNVKTIALTYSKQVVSFIPQSPEDVKIDWLVTEEKIFDTSTKR